MQKTTTFLRVMNLFQEPKEIHSHLTCTPKSLAPLRRTTDFLQQLARRTGWQGYGISSLATRFSNEATLREFALSEGCTIFCVLRLPWRAAIRLLLASYNALLLEHLFRRSLRQTSPKYTNIQTVVTDTKIFAFLSQQMNDHESEITHVNVTRVKARETVSYQDSKPL